MSFKNVLQFYFSDPPVVKIDTTWKHAAEGDTVDFQCKVEANPVPKVRSLAKRSAGINSLLCR